MDNCYGEETHNRVILHLVRNLMYFNMNLLTIYTTFKDIDYFYAQVEEIINPELKNFPLGVRQGLNIVTCNYLARSSGLYFLFLSK